MWYRMEGNTRKCTCGGVAEQWLVLAGAKRIVQTYICPTCHPQLADYVSRQPVIVPWDYFRKNSPKGRFTRNRKRANLSIGPSGTKMAAGDDYDQQARLERKTNGDQILYRMPDVPRGDQPALHSNPLS